MKAKAAGADLPVPAAVRDVRAEGRDATRRAVMQLASQAVSQGGLTNLSMRRVAELSGTSTMVLYTLFGGKDGLLDAVYADSFEQLRAAITGAVHPDAPLERVISMCQTYRAFALAHPAHYALMLGPGFAPSEASREVALQSLEPLLAVLRELTPAADGLDDLGLQLWLATHGLVSAELAGFFGLSEAKGERLLDQMVRGLLLRVPG